MTHFNDLDLRIGKIIGAKDHPNADKLYILLVDIKKEKELQLVAGLKKHYKKEEILGKKVVVFANLQSTVLRGIESFGMVLAAVDEDNVALLTVKKSNPGDKVFIDEASKKSKPIHKIPFEDWKHLKLYVSDGHVVFDGKVLKTEKEDVLVDKKVRNGAPIQ